jgi:DinB superfamily
MIVERCEQCRFEGERWTDIEALTAIAVLPARWRKAVSGLTSDQLHYRPIPEMWSIAEYVDHVREVLFGMRFLLDTAVAQPGTDLGEPPETRFDPEPRFVDIEVALSGIDSEASALRDRLAELPGSAWYSKVTAGGDEVDARWIARHAVHDATHHLLDVDRLREAL